MIANNWRRMLAKAGMTQNQLAEAVGMNKGEMSRVCGGTAVPSWDALLSCCACLACGVDEIYGANELLVLYQVGVEQKPKKPPRVRVQLSDDVAAMIDQTVSDGHYVNRVEAVNSMLTEAFLQ